jgi:hypothetical protein
MGWKMDQAEKFLSLVANGIEWVDQSCEPFKTFALWLQMGLDGIENTSPRQYFKCFGLQSFRGRAPTDLTVLKKMPPSQPSWPRAAGNKHIVGGLCRRNLSNKGLFFV